MNFATGRQEEEDSKTFVCQWLDGAITCVFCRDLHLTLMSTGLLKTGLFKGRWSLAESFFKQNYCHVCHTKFTVFFPLPSCCVFKTFYSVARQPKVKCFHSWAIILPERFGQIVFMRLKTLSNTNLESWRRIKREKGSIPFDVCRWKKAFA